MRERNLELPHSTFLLGLTSPFNDFSFELDSRIFAGRDRSRYNLCDMTSLMGKQLLRMPGSLNQLFRNGNSVCVDTLAIESILCALYRFVGTPMI